MENIIDSLWKMDNEDFGEKKINYIVFQMECKLDLKIFLVYKELHEYAF